MSAVTSRLLLPSFWMWLQVADRITTNGLHRAQQPGEAECRTIASYRSKQVNSFSSVTEPDSRKVKLRPTSELIHSSPEVICN